MCVFFYHYILIIYKDNQMTIKSNTIVSEEGETQWAGKSNPDNGSNIQEQVFSEEKSQDK